MTCYVGIDLGTTNSVVAMKTLTTKFLLNEEGHELTPSCVTVIPSVQSEDTFIIGKHACDLAKQYPGQTIRSVKRLMGRDFDDPEIQKWIDDKPYGYSIVRDPNDPINLQIELANQKLYSPENISSEILKKLIRDLPPELKNQDVQAVVTVPAYFSDKQKYATRMACQYAGLQILRLLPEPTSAAIAFGMAELAAEDAKTLMVFDLGGGTFDVSVLSVASGHFMEVTKGGNMWLGGDDIDLLIRDHVLSQTEKKTGINDIKALIESLDSTSKARFNLELKEKCEKAKILLSTQDEANIECFGILSDTNKTLIDIDETICISEFNTLIQPLVDKVVTITTHILQDIRYEPDLIDTVIMVGGSSLIPAFQTALKNLFSDSKVHLHSRPMFAIAEGAAIMAHRLSARSADEKKNMEIMHSTAHNYYLQLANGNRHLLLARNTPLPCKVEEKLVFSQEGQELARLRILNEVDGILETVGELWFHNNSQDALETWEESKKRNSLCLTFEIDEDNIIKMQARSLENSHHQIATSIARGGLSMRLYADLEKTLSSMLSNGMPVFLAKAYLQLSKIISKTITSVTNIQTGYVNQDLKLRTFKQISTLEKLASLALNPLHAYVLAKSLCEQTPPLFSVENQEKLFLLTSNLLKSLLEFTDADCIETDLDRLEEFYEKDISNEIVSEAMILCIQGKEEWPNTCKKIEEQFANLGSGILNNDQNVIERAYKALTNIASEFSSSYGKFTHEFDRDVQLI